MSRHQVINWLLKQRMKRVEMARRLRERECDNWAIAQAVCWETEASHYQQAADALMKISRIPGNMDTSMIELPDAQEVNGG